MEFPTSPTCTAFPASRSVVPLFGLLPSRGAAAAAAAPAAAPSTTASGGGGGVEEFSWDVPRAAAPQTAKRDEVKVADEEEGREWGWDVQYSARDCCRDVIEAQCEQQARVSLRAVAGRWSFPADAEQPVGVGASDAATASPLSSPPLPPSSPPPSPSLPSCARADGKWGISSCAKFLAERRRRQHEQQVRLGCGGGAVGGNALQFDPLPGNEPFQSLTRNSERKNFSIGAPLFAATLLQQGQQQQQQQRRGGDEGTSPPPPPSSMGFVAHVLGSACIAELRRELEEDVFERFSGGAATKWSEHPPASDDAISDASSAATHTFVL